MNKIKIAYGETIQPRQFESRRYDIELEIETMDDIAIEADKLFTTAKSIIKKQKEVV